MARFPYSPNTFATRGNDILYWAYYSYSIRLVELGRIKKSRPERKVKEDDEAPVAGGRVDGGHWRQKMDGWGCSEEELLSFLSRTAVNPRGQQRGAGRGSAWQIGNRSPRSPPLPHPPHGIPIPPPPAAPAAAAAPPEDHSLHPPIKSAKTKSAKFESSSSCLCSLHRLLPPPNNPLPLLIPWRAPNRAPSPSPSPSPPSLQPPPTPTVDPLEPSRAEPPSAASFPAHLRLFPRRVSALPDGRPAPLDCAAPRRARRSRRLPRRQRRRCRSRLQVLCGEV
ncbi:hypothetical protein NL676_016388 [Syzygium grande]|nr:hypothetical protein NL676_016388 [Syzygium grande]